MTLKMYEHLIGDDVWTWTGEKCPACKGTGDNPAEDDHIRTNCPDCGGTGEEFKKIREATASDKNDDQQL